MVWCLSFRKQRAASCPSARPGCANGKGVRRDPKRNEIDRPTGQFRLSFWVEAPWSALRGWPLSNRTDNAARPSSRTSEVLVFCLSAGSSPAVCTAVAGRRNECSKERSLLASTVLFVRRRSHVVRSGQAAISASRLKIRINPGGHATVAGTTIERETDEPFPACQARCLTVAKAAGLAHVVLGGLPD